MAFQKLSIILAIFATVMLPGCGGGGGGNDTTPPSSTPPTPQQPAVATGIENQAGSSCSFEYLPQGRILDMDKAGYTAFYIGHIKCTLASGAIERLAGVPLSAFKLTGNGVTASTPEAMVTGTASIDGAHTYMLQTYRSFANAASLTSQKEDLVIAGQDSLGRKFTATQQITTDVSETYGLDDLTAGGAVAGNRVVDADGMGYKATTYLVAYAAKTPSTSSACPVGAVKDVPLVSVNRSSQSVDRRYCMYTNLTASDFAYTQGIATQANTWGWNDGTQPSLLSLTSASIVSQSITGQRTPIYKLETSVRYPSAAAGGLAAVEKGPGWTYYSVSGLLSFETATVRGAQWLR